jgi:hypothetical protein
VSSCLKSSSKRRRIGARSSSRARPWPGARGVAAPGSLGRPGRPPRASGNRPPNHACQRGSILVMAASVSPFGVRGGRRRNLRARWRARPGPCRRARSLASTLISRDAPAWPGMTSRTKRRRFSASVHVQELRSPTARVLASSRFTSGPEAPSGYPRRRHVRPPDGSCATRSDSEPGRREPAPGRAPVGLPMPRCRKALRRLGLAGDGAVFA